MEALSEGSTGDAKECLQRLLDARKPLAHR
jgi:hypothetical protein